MPSQLPSLRLTAICFLPCSPWCEQCGMGSCPRASSSGSCGPYKQGNLHRYAYLSFISVDLSLGSQCRRAGDAQGGLVKKKSQRVGVPFRDAFTRTASSLASRLHCFDSMEFIILRSMLSVYCMQSNTPNARHKLLAALDQHIGRLILSQTKGISDRQNGADDLNIDEIAILPGFHHLSRREEVGLQLVLIQSVQST